MEAANLGSWDWDLDTDEVHFDSRWASIFGHALDQKESDSSIWQKPDSSQWTTASF